MISLVLPVLLSLALARPPVPPGAITAPDSMKSDVVFGGKQADWHRARASKMVRFVTANDKGEIKTFCSGYLLSNHQVLSAGHCFIDARKQSIHKSQVFAEIYDPQNPKSPKRIPVSAHQSEFEGKGGFDLSVVHLSESAGQKAPFGQIAEQECDSRRGYFAVGFGMTEKGVTADGPKEAKYIAEKGTDLMIRGRAINDDLGRVCKGDSGGPIFCYTKDRQFVITSILHSLISDNPIATQLYLDGKLPLHEFCRTSVQLTGLNLPGFRDKLEQLRQRPPVTSSWSTTVQPAPKPRR